MHSAVNERQINRFIPTLLTTAPRQCQVISRLCVRNKTLETIFAGSHLTQRSGLYVHFSPQVLVPESYPLKSFGDTQMDCQLKCRPAFSISTRNIPDSYSPIRQEMELSNAPDPFTSACTFRKAFMDKRGVQRSYLSCRSCGLAIDDSASCVFTQTEFMSDHLAVSAFSSSCE